MKEIRRDIASVGAAVAAPLASIAALQMSYLFGHGSSKVPGLIYLLIQIGAIATLLAQPGWTIWKRCVYATLLTGLSFFALTIGTLWVSCIHGDCL